jgi:hypothetical protein
LTPNQIYYIDLSAGTSGNQPSYISTASTYNPVTNQLSGSSLGITASFYGTASNAISASYASGSLTGSFLGIGSGSFSGSHYGYFTGSMYGTASNSVTSSYTISSSYAVDYGGIYYFTASSSASYSNTYISSSWIPLLGISQSGQYRADLYGQVVYSTTTPVTIDYDITWTDLLVGTTTLSPMSLSLYPNTTANSQASIVFFGKSGSNFNLSYNSATTYAGSVYLITSVAITRQFPI